MKVHYHNDYFTRISNYFLDRYSSISSSQFSLMICIFRHTAGHNRASCKLSHSQFAIMTSLSKQTVAKGIKELKEKGLLLIERVNGCTTQYTLPDKFLTGSFTKIKNGFIDEQQAKLTPSEFKSYILLTRKTHGYQKTTDRIANSQISKLTGNSLKTVIKSKWGLVKKGLISLNLYRRSVSEVSIPDYTLEECVPPPLKITLGPPIKITHQPPLKITHTKERIKIKETNTYNLSLRAKGSVQFFQNEDVSQIFEDCKFSELDSVQQASLKKVGFVQTEAGLKLDEMIEAYHIEPEDYSAEDSMKIAEILKSYPDLKLFYKNLNRQDKECFRQFFKYECHKKFTIKDLVKFVKSGLTEHKPSRNIYKLRPVGKYLYSILDSKKKTKNEDKKLLMDAERYSKRGDELLQEEKNRLLAEEAKNALEALQSIEMLETGVDSSKVKYTITSEENLVFVSFEDQYRRKNSLPPIQYRDSNFRDTFKSYLSFDQTLLKKLNLQ